MKLLQRLRGNPDEPVLMRQMRARAVRMGVLGAILLLTIGVGVLAIIRSQVQSDRASQTASQQNKQRDDDLACIRRWADAVTRRSKQIDMYAKPRNAAAAAVDEALARNTIRPGSVSHAEIAKAYVTLTRTAKAYQVAVLNNPPLPNPSLLCGTPSDPPTGRVKASRLNLPTPTRAAASNPVRPSADPASTPTPTPGSSSAPTTSAVTPAPTSVQTRTVVIPVPHGTGTTLVPIVCLTVDVPVPLIPLQAAVC